MAMRQNNHLRIGLAELGGDRTEQLRFFALLNLGLVQSLAGGVMSAAEAGPFFYNAENCLYIREHLRSKEADTIMSHGVQLPDLFECLTSAEASREFFHELETIRSHCMNLLAARRSPNVAGVKTRSKKSFNAKRRRAFIQ